MVLVYFLCGLSSVEQRHILMQNVKQQRPSTLRSLAQSSYKQTRLVQETMNAAAVAPSSSKNKGVRLVSPGEASKIAVEFPRGSPLNEETQKLALLNHVRQMKEILESLRRNHNDDHPANLTEVPPVVHYQQNVQIFPSFTGETIVTLGQKVDELCDFVAENVLMPLAEASMFDHRMWVVDHRDDRDVRPDAIQDRRHGYWRNKAVLQRPVALMSRERVAPVEEEEC